MWIDGNDGGDIRLGGLDRVLLTFLRQAPDAANPHGDPNALKRLHPSPVKSGEEDFLEDWREFVQPELQHLFEEANETVRRDLNTATEDPLAGDGAVVTVPRRHLDAWLRCLNQARLVIAEKFRFSEEELNAELTQATLQPRDLALFQVQFYGFIQEHLVRSIEE